MTVRVGEHYANQLELAKSLRALLPVDPDPPRLVEGRYLLNAGPSRRGWHRAESMIRCPQWWAYNHHPAFKSLPTKPFPDSPPLIRGSLFHVAVAHFYRRLQAIQETGDNRDAERFHLPRRACELVSAEIDNDPRRHPDSPLWSSFIEEATAAITAYIAHYRSHDDRVIIATEYPLALAVEAAGWTLDPAVREYWTTGRADLIWLGADNYVYIDDSKTRGRIDPRQERGYARSGQFQGLRLMGERVFGGYFGGIGTNYATYKHDREKVARGEQSYAFSFQRRAPPVLPYRLACHGDAIRHAEWLEQALVSSGMDPYRFPKASAENGGCEHRYGPCPAAYVCDYGPGGVPAGMTPLSARSDGRSDAKEELL